MDINLHNTKKITVHEMAPLSTGTKMIALRIELNNGEDIFINLFNREKSIQYEVQRQTPRDEMEIRRLLSGVSMEEV